MCQELIEAEAGAQIGTGLYEGPESRTTERNGHRPRLCPLRPATSSPASPRSVRPASSLTSTWTPFTCTYETTTTWCPRPSSSQPGSCSPDSYLGSGGNRSWSRPDGYRVAPSPPFRPAWADDRTVVVHGTGVVPFDLGPELYKRDGPRPVPTMARHLTRRVMPRLAHAR